MASARSRAAVDLLEDLAAEFEEAGEHVAGQPEFGELHLAPVRLLGLEQLIPGAVGWGRELTHRRDPLRPGPSDGGAQRAGWVYLIVRPAPPSNRGRAEPGSPLRGTRWEELAFAAECKGIPNAIVAATSEDAEATPVVRKFAEGLLGELETESAP